MCWGCAELPPPPPPPRLNLFVNYGGSMRTHTIKKTCWWRSWRSMNIYTDTNTPPHPHTILSSHQSPNLTEVSSAVLFTPLQHSHNFKKRR